MKKEKKEKKPKKIGWGGQTQRIIRVMTENADKSCAEVSKMLEMPILEKNGKLLGAGVPAGKGRLYYRYHAIEGTAPGVWVAEKRGRKPKERPFLAANSAAMGITSKPVKTKAEVKIAAAVVAQTPETPKAKTSSKKAKAEAKAKPETKPETKPEAKPETKTTDVKAKNLARLKAVAEKRKASEIVSPVPEPPGFDAPASLSSEEVAALV